MATLSPGGGGPRLPPKSGPDAHLVTVRQNASRIRADQSQASKRRTQTPHNRRAALLETWEPEGVRDEDYGGDGQRNCRNGAT